MVGLLALTYGEQVTLEIEIKSPWGEQLPASLGFSPTAYPHITTSHKWKSKYERELEPLVGRLLGRVDIYMEDWSNLGENVYKVWKGGAKERKINKAVEGASGFREKAVEGASGFREWQREYQRAPGSCELSFHKAVEGASGFREKQSVYQRGPGS